MREEKGKKNSWEGKRGEEGKEIGRGMTREMADNGVKGEKGGEQGDGKGMRKDKVKNRSGKARKKQKKCGKGRARETE